VITTALIADDEEAPRAQLLAALHVVWPELQVVEEARNGVDAWDAFLQHEPQVCFLDVRMPGLTGVEVAQRIGTSADIVFVAAHGDHTLAAFDAGAVDYLLKPVTIEPLSQVVTRLKAQLANPDAGPTSVPGLLDRLAGQVRRPAYLDVIQGGLPREMKLIRTEDVVYFESEGRYTRVVHSDGDALLRVPLKELLGQLDPALFWQIHRSVIVNQRHIANAESLDEGGVVVALRGRPERLPVSRHFEGLFTAA
jgi:DNA-binding LytR/AlgR family response regulator